MAVKPSRLSCPLRKWRPPQTGLSMRRSNRVSSLGHVYFIRLVGERATGGRCLGLPVEHIWLLSRVRLKIIHWRLSPEPPELAGFYVDSVLFTKNLTGLPSVYCGALLRFEPCKHSLPGPSSKFSSISIFRIATIYFASCSQACQKRAGTNGSRHFDAT